MAYHIQLIVVIIVYRRIVAHWFGGEFKYIFWHPGELSFKDVSDIISSAIPGRSIEILLDIIE